MPADSPRVGRHSATMLPNAVAGYSRAGLATATLGQPRLIYEDEPAALHVTAAARPSPAAASSLSALVCPSSLSRI